jgi:NAD+ synthase
MKGQELEDHIVGWLKDYVTKHSISGFVIGISGGIDSSVVSTLCAKTGFPVLAIDLPINKVGELSTKQISHLTKNFDNVEGMRIDLTESYNVIKDTLNLEGEKANLSLANTQSRLRMLALYSQANNKNYIVCGTGNKVEDFGLFFYSKGGDGMVDISPIADLMKSEVYDLGKHLGIIEEIINVAPTDGLWDGSPTDEEQLGGTYDEFEWAMKWEEDHMVFEQGVDPWYDDSDDNTLTDRQNEVLDIYRARHRAGLHKSLPIPICKISK